LKIEATAKQIRALLEYAAADAQQADPKAAAHKTAGVQAPRALPRPILERYRSLLDIGRGPAVVPIERGTCCGCNIRLPTMLECQTHRAPALFTCPHCRRMMYTPELLEPTPVAAPVAAAAAPVRTPRATTSRKTK
jgi:predicted  nucleic acid-binding Zn-ribbon protein